MHTSRWIAISASLALLAITGCIDGGDPGPDGRESGRQCTWDVTDAATDAVLERWTYAYAVGGHLIWQAVDYGAKGAHDFRIDYWYDENDRVVREEMDDDGSAEPDRIYHHHYDAAGLRTVTEIESAAMGVDARHYFRYDASNRLTMREDDLNLDGDIDARTTWTYDADDNPVRVELDHGPDGVPNQIVAQHYEPIAGQFRLVLREGDWDGDGVWDYRHRLLWTDDGLLEGREIDADGDGTVNERWRYHYDPSGARIGGDGDTNGDGEWDVRQTYHRECRIWQDPDR